MRCILIMVLFSCTISLTAQDLKGIWRGTRTQNAGGCFPEYSLELHITYMDRNVFMGNAYSFDHDRFTKVNFTGRYNPLNKRMVITEHAVLQYNVPDNCIPCIKTYDLNWAVNAEGESISGEWKGHEMGNSNSCQPGKIQLMRVDKPTFPVDVFQSDTLANLQKTHPQEKREKELVQIITVDTSTMKIELYDNAEIDDDTVTVFLNNAMLLYKKRLTDKPLTLDVQIFPNTDYELLMYAENLGRIPPNTSLMVITAGAKRYEVRISANQQKSAVVKFRYQK